MNVKPSWCGLLLCVLALPSQAEMRVAVMEFTNASQGAELEALGKGLQSMLTTDLAVVKSVGVVERERLKEVRQEIQRTRAAGFDKKSVAQFGKLVGATHLLVGSFTVVGESMRLDGRLIDVGTGQVLLAEQMTGEKALFFELEQQLAQKVIGSLGAKIAPKEKAQLAKAHTADFEAFRQYSSGLAAFDEGRLEDAVTALNAATALDHDFKLASLTLEEYERLVAQVKDKATAAGRVENELARLEKNSAIAAEVTVIQKLWKLLEATKGTTQTDAVRRVAAACSLSAHYRTQLGFQNRGPVNSSDLAAAGFDDFSLQRTSESLLKRAWAEAPQVFPALPPLCIKMDGLSSSNKRPVEELLQFEIDDAHKLFESNDTILSYMGNRSTVEEAAERMRLDAPAVVRLWEQLYSLAQKLPQLSDEARLEFEKNSAEARRRAGDFDGSTQLFAAASRRTKDSYALRTLAEHIEKNKTLKSLVGTTPSLLREYFLLNPSAHPSELTRLAPPAANAQLLKALERARALSEREWFLFNGLSLWYLKGPTFGAWLTTGARTSALAAKEIHYRGEAGREDEKPVAPLLLSSAVRGKKPAVSVHLEGEAAAGVTFAMQRVLPEGGIERDAPVLTVAYAVVSDGASVRLMRVTRDGEHRYATQELAKAAVDAKSGARKLEVNVGESAVSVRLNGKSMSFPLKLSPAEADGFVGFVFQGSGEVVLSQSKVSLQ